MKPLRLSQSGQCGRALAFDQAGIARPPFDAVSRRRMDLGFAFEALVIDALAAEGYRITDSQRAVSLCGIVGHVDGLIAREHEPLRLLEIKSMGLSSWRDWQGNGLRFARAPYVRAYYAQVQAYLAGLRAESVDVDACRLEVALRDERWDPHVDLGEAEPARPWTFKRAVEIIPYDLDEAMHVAARLSRVQALDRAMPGEDMREYSLDDEGLLVSACRWCDHRETCWGPLVKIRRGRSTRFMPESEVTF